MAIAPSMNDHARGVFRWDAILTSILSFPFERLGVVPDLGVPARLASTSLPHLLTQHICFAITSRVDRAGLPARLHAQGQPLLRVAARRVRDI